MTEQERVMRKREQVRETEGEHREGRKFKFKGIEGHKDERDYNMMKRWREEGRGESRPSYSCPS